MTAESSTKAKWDKDGTLLEIDGVVLWLWEQNYWARILGGAPALRNAREVVAAATANPPQTAEFEIEDEDGGVRKARMKMPAQMMGAPESRPLIFPAPPKVSAAVVLETRVESLFQLLRAALGRMRILQDGAGCMVSLGSDAGIADADTARKHASIIARALMHARAELREVLGAEEDDSLLNAIRNVAPEILRR